MGKTIIKNIAAVLILTAITSLVWTIVAGVLMGVAGFVQTQPTDPAAALGSMLAVFAMCGTNAILVIWYAKKSSYSGRKLFGNIFILIFGIMSFMTQIETLYFNNSIDMPILMIGITVLIGALSAIVYALYGVRVNKKNPIKEARCAKIMQVENFTEKMTIMAFVYLIFYFGFGYFIAWQFSALREYYSGSTAIVPFWTHMMNQVNQDAGLIVFQIIRGYLWAAIGFILLRGLHINNRAEKIILMGLLLSVPLATPLFAPNEYMPDAVRFGHFFELLIENFLFGAILTVLFESKAKLFNKRSAKSFKA